MNSTKKLMLPVADSPVIEDVLLYKGSTMTKRGAYAAMSYMACAVFYRKQQASSSQAFYHTHSKHRNPSTAENRRLIPVDRKKQQFSTQESSIVGEPWSMTNSSTLVPFKTLVRTLPLAISYLLYMLASMESVRCLSVPMYTTLRRTTVAFTMIVEYLLAGRKHSASVVGTVGIIVLGAIIAGARDLSFDLYGYAVVFISNICTAIYLASIARIGKSSGLNSFGLMWCNGILCGPILLFWTSVRGDLEVLINFPHLYSPGFQAVMLLSCIMAFFLNYCIFLNTTLNSALTQTVCGNLKDFVTIGLGWLLFGGLPFDLLNIVGQSIGCLGSCLYAYSTLRGT